MKTWESILGYPIPPDQNYYDFAILIPEANTQFTDNSQVSTICLPNIDAEFPEDEIITTATNYNRKYSERPTDHLFRPAHRNPKRASCTTTELGVYTDSEIEKSKFKPCKIDFLERNEWQCKKGRTTDDLPMSYELEVCEEYWTMANDLVKKIGGDKSTRFLTVDKIKIISECSNWVPECLRLDQFEDSGWCQVEGNDIDDWGICDFQCEYAKVMYLIWNVISFIAIFELFDDLPVSFQFHLTR